jgi:hypothetical protein
MGEAVLGEKAEENERDGTLCGMVTRSDCLAV